MVKVLASYVKAERTREMLAGLLSLEKWYMVVQIESSHFYRVIHTCYHRQPSESMRIAHKTAKPGNEGIGASFDA